jgi:hypothetical protein
LTIAAKVKPRAVAGPRTLTILQTSQPILTQTGFTVTRGPAEISSVSLPSIKQLEGPLPITVTGLNTNFDAALTSISFGAGVTVANLRNVTATSATVDITVAADAAPGFRTVSAITEGEVAELIGTFRVEAGAPVINSVTFAGEATQGRTFDLTIDGRFLTIDATTTAVFAPAGITVNSITNVPQLGNNFRATVNITVQATTALGARGLTLATGTATATRASVLNVVPGAAAISGVTPNRARRGQNNVELVVEGTATTFGPTTTFAFNPSSGITNVSISAGPNTQATVRVNLDAAAPLGARSLTLTTGGEVATLANAFTVDAAVLDISTLTLPYGTTGQNYNQTVAATGGAAPFNFTVSAGTLPGGVTLNPTSGLISGVPTTAGAYSFTVQVTDGSSQAATKAYTVNIYDPLTISTTALDAGLVGLAYSRTIIATGGAAPRTFSLQSGTLPGGLTLDPATGTLAGSPLAAATSSFTVRVTDNVGQTRDQAYNVTIYPALVFTTAALPAARSTVAYNQTVAFAGGVPSVQVEVASGALPGGLTVSNAGVINGTPSATGTFNFELKLTDAQLNTKLQAFSIAVTAATSITTTSLPNGVVGRAYAATIATTDGVDPLEFSISAGSLPNSLSIGATTGVINGTPSLAGTFNFTVRVKDAQNFIVTREYAVTIAPPPQLISISRADLAQALTATIDITGLNTNFVEGTTVAHFGLGVTVLRTRVTNLAQAQVDITVDSNAAPGPRTVTVTTGAEVASRTDFFTVLAGLPEVSAIAPAAGRRSTTVAVTVTGRNLLGASFALRSPDPSFTTPPGTVSIVSNDGTMAVLSMALGATEGQFNLAATTPLGASLPLAGSQFVIAPGNGSAGASASVLNTFAAAGTFPGIPGGRNTATFYASVLNTALSESATPSIPAGRNTATFYASVLNTALNESANPSLPPGRSTATFYASVLNTGFNVSGSGLFSTAVALPVTVCNRETGCPAIQPQSIPSLPLLSSLASGTAGGLAPMLEPVETQGSQPVIAGQSILLEAREAGHGATVEFEINGVSVARLSEAPYATLFTVPASVKELTFRVLVRSAEGVERASRLTRLAVVPDLGTTFNGTASFAPGTTSEGVTLHLAAGGLKAEYFDFAAPLTEQPNLTEAKPTRTSYVSAVNQPNPDAVFGDDPLGTGLTPDLAVRYTGELWVETPGLHRFRLSARSGASLRIDGEPVIDTGFTTGAAGRSEISVELKRGWHAVELVYAHGVGPQSLRWEWQRPGDARLEVVDQRHLRTPLDLISAVPDGEGNFSFAGVPAALDTVWVRSVRGKEVREYPALWPGGAEPVRIVISQ